jgi:hypothetical protein
LHGFFLINAHTVASIQKDSGTISLTNMAVSTKTASIFLSIIFSASLIIGAFFLSSPIRIPVAGAEYSDELLKEYAAKDTDADGLKDWQEVLYGADPTNAHSLDASLTDGEAVREGKAALRVLATRPESMEPEVPGTDAAPETLTDRFTREFFGNYLLQRGQQAPTEEEFLAFIKDATADLTTQTSIEEPYTAIEVIPGGSGEAAVETYLSLAGKAMTPSGSYDRSKDELDYFSEGMGGKTASYAHVRAVGTLYTNIARALMNVPAPYEVATAHLRVANAYAALGQVAADMAEMPNDPLRALVALDRYSEVRRNLGEALQTFAATLKESRPTPSP